jgi:hypothetical protein
MARCVASYIAISFETTSSDAVSLKTNQKNRNADTRHLAETWILFQRCLYNWRAKLDLPETGERVGTTEHARRVLPQASSVTQAITGDTSVTEHLWREANQCVQQGALFTTCLPSSKRKRGHAKVILVRFAVPPFPRPSYKSARQAAGEGYGLDQTSKLAA